MTNETEQQAADNRPDVVEWPRAELVKHKPFVTMTNTAARELLQAHDESEAILNDEVGRLEEALRAIADALEGAPRQAKEFVAVITAYALARAALAGGTPPDTTQTKEGE